LKPEQGSAAVRAVLEQAETCARDRGAAEVSSLDLVLAIARLGPGHLGPIFERYGLTREKLEDAVRARAGGANGAAAKAPAGPLPPAADLASAVARAGRAAASLGRETYEPEDVLIALLGDRGAEATDLLRTRFDFTREKLTQDLALLRGQERMVARAEGHDACGGHGAAEGEGPPGEGPIGIAAELRDLEGRFRALCENVNEMRARENEMVVVLRRLWIAFWIVLLFLIALGAAVIAPRLR
jgi:ATP-dependent Clp protease ATP-binding subunit ClpA